MSEAFAKLPTGYAYAVVLRGGGPTQRLHDERPLPQLLDAWSEAIDHDPAKLFRFSGAIPGELEPGGSSDERPATFAGAACVEEIVCIRYWSPQDEAPSDRAYEAAEALLDSLAGRGVPLGEEPESPAEEPAGDRESQAAQAGGVSW